jgi:tetratricopeptide (TPR) repeat protein
MERIDGLSGALSAAAPRVQLLAAAVLIEAGALEAAWEPISEAARTTDDPRLRAELGDQLLRLARGWEARGQPEEAHHALRFAAQLVPRRAVPALARHAQRDGCVEEAVALWAEAIRLDPGHADHHLRYGRLLEAHGRFQQAYDAYLHLVEELPTASSALTVAPRLERLVSRLPPAPELVTRIAMLGSATLDQLRDCLLVQAHRAGLRPEIHVAGADPHGAAILDPDSELYRFAPDLLVLAIHRGRLFPELDDLHWPLPSRARHQAIRSGVDRVRRMLHAFRAHCSALVLLHNMVVPQHSAPGAPEWEDRVGRREVFHLINLRLARLVATEFRDVRILDVDGVQERCGKAAATDPRFWLAAGIPWSESLLMPLAREHLGHLVAHRGMGRGCLIVSLDNTLWGGVVAEDGVEGVRVGSHAPGNAFLLLQHQVHQLWKRGVTLAVCSTASRDDAAAMFDTHPDMLLRMEHFAATRIGCRSQPTGVREIAAELDLGLESIVFWDGDPGDRTRMRADLPRVLTPDVPTDAARHRQALVDLAVFDRPVIRET